MTDVVVVTGASGFIGRALTAVLAGRGREVWAVARTAPPSAPGVRPHRVASYLATPAAPGATLVHLAETADVAQAEVAGEAHLRANLECLEELFRKGYGRVVYVSSATGRGLYARAKQACEERVLAVGGVVARLTSVYGSGMSKRTVISEILAQLHGNGPLRIRDGAAERDFLWLEDAAEGLAHLALGRTPGRFELGTGHAVRIDELARLLLDLAGEAKRPLVETAPTGSSERLSIDPEPVERAFGWRAATPLRDGLARLLEQRA